MPWLAVRYRSDRIAPSLGGVIRRTMPNRIRYLDDQGFDMHPFR